MPKAVSISKIDGKPGHVYYPLSLDEVPKPSPTGKELLIKIHAAALNHRDLFIRQSLYPGTTFGVPLLADGSGTVVAVGPDANPRWKGKKVIVNPGTGWKDSPEGPEEKGGYKILGGTKTNPNGTLQEYMAIDEGEVEEAPAHLSLVEAAALPLTGLTAWRAVMTKCGEHNLKPGKNILITGIGGGVALMALEFARAAGANVYVSSGSEEKLQKAIKLGAKGGINYKEEAWEKKLLGLLPAENKQLDAIVDGAGGDAIEKGAKLLKARFPLLLDSLTYLLTLFAARWRHCSLWYDRRTQNAVLNAGSLEKYRGQGFNYGFKKGIQRHGEFHPIHQGPTSRLARHPRI